MLIAFDAGNSHVAVGVFAGHHLKTSFKLASDPRRTQEEYAFLLGGILQAKGIQPAEIDAAAIGSVVPTLTERFEQLCSQLFGLRALVVGSGARTGVHVATHNPREVGPDRVLNAAAAFHIYGGPVIVLDFGTATAFDVVGADGAYLGTAMAPGLAVSAEALFERASRLHRVDLVRPRTAIGKDSAAALQSGIIFGHAALVEGMVARIRAELGMPCRVVATGELADLIQAETRCIEAIEPNLTLIGLRLTHELNEDAR